MSEEHSTSVPVTEEDLRKAGLPDNMAMAPGLAVFFNEGLYQRCKAVALRMSEAEGIIGKHLIGKPSACMAILSRSITWNLDPFAVAQATYEVKGKVGYEGKLVQAILENSGAIQGRISYTFFGDWDKLRGKFKMVASGSEGKKPQQEWKDDDEIGLGLKVSAQVKGETEPRSEEFFLSEMQPRNSTLWILRPKQQMIYASVRAFANIACPGIIMGIPFDVDPYGFGGEAPVDITPERPVRPNEFSRSPSRTNPTYAELVARANHATKITEIADIRAQAQKDLPADQLPDFEELCDRLAKALTDKGPASTPRQEEQQPDDSAVQQEEEQAPETKLVSEELTRGLDILSRQTTKVDINDLRNTIKEELTDTEELVIWKKACDDKIATLPAGGKAKPK